MTTIRCLTRAFALSLPIFAIGCGKPALVPAYGKATYRQQPLNNGLVVLTPEERGPLAIGRIGPDGSFVLFTGENQGAYPGTYRVTVSSLAPGSSTSESGRFEIPNSALPPKYREIDRDPNKILRFVIEANKSNILPVPLTD